MSNLHSYVKVNHKLLRQCYFLGYSYKHTRLLGYIFTRILHHELQGT